MTSLYAVTGFAKRLISRFYHRGIGFFQALVILIFLIFIIMPGEAKADRFFQTHNTWYETISNSTGNDPLSAGKITQIRNYDSYIAANNVWAPNMWQATPSTPTTTLMKLDCAKSPTRTDCINTWPWETQGWNLNVPMPIGSVASQNQATLNCWPNYCADGKMIVISADGNTIWELGMGVYFPPDFTAVPAEFRGKWATKYLRRWDATGTGVNYPDDGLASVNDGGVPLAHGLITYNEIVNAGEINHALAMTVKPASVCAAQHTGVYPAGVTLYTSTDRTNTDAACIKSGERLYLNSSVNCETLNTSYPMVKKVCRALQTYGGIIMDFGDLSVYIESSEGQTWSWSGIRGDLGVIPTDKLKVSLPIYPTTSDTVPTH